MKKLMIAAAIVCAAVASQAASFTWKTGQYNQLYNATSGSAITTTDAYSTYMNGGSIVLVLLTEGTYDGAKTVLTGTSGGTATFKTAPATMAGGVSTTFNFNYTSGILKDGDVIGVMYKDKSGKLSQLNLYDAEKGLVGDAIDATYTVSGLDSKGNTWAGTAFQFTENGTSTAKAGWTAVPEPTSGLLLLLGMAGLALRRRRA